MPRKEIPELEKMLQYEEKKFARYDEGAKLYSMIRSPKVACQIVPRFALPQSVPGSIIEFAPYFSDLFPCLFRGQPI